MNQHISKVLNDDVSLLRKIGYSFSGIGNEFIYSGIGLYLMVFFTDVALIGAAAGGMIMMISRGWDAFADFIMGYICDHSRSKRLFVIVGAIPLGVVFALLFQTPDLSIAGRELYYGILAWLTWTVFTVVTMPLGAMVPNMTMDPHVRTKITGMQKAAGLLTLIALGGAFWPIVNLLSVDGNTATGFSRIGISMGIIAAISFIIAGLASQERHMVAPEHRYQLKKAFGILIQNKPYIILVSAVCLTFMVFTMIGMLLNYFFKYCVPFESFIPIAFTCTFVIATIALPFWVMLSKKIGKRLVYQISFLGYGLILFINFFIYTPLLPLLLPLFFLAGIFFGGLSLSFVSIMPDTVDYGQWKTGSRCEGLQFGFYGFIIKLAGSLAGLVVGLALEYSGYRPNVAQSESSLVAIRVMMTVIPFLLCVAGAVIMHFYALDEGTHKKICTELETRHEIS